MDVLIVSSREDPAGVLLDAALENHQIDATIRQVDGSLLDWTAPKDYDLVIFLSKHRAASGNDAMCVHAIGNFGEARFGGRDGMLVPTIPSYLTALYQALSARNPKTALGRYEVSLEAVHHGPFLTTPAIFYELGSSEENWSDVDAARVMAQVLVEVLSDPPTPRESFFGLGGNHYCAGFQELVEEYDFAGSCAKYALPDLTEDHLRFIDRYDRIVLDWQNLGSHKQRVLRMLDELGIEYVRRKKL